MTPAEKILAVISKMEPEANITQLDSSTIAAMSIAISLKRIADVIASAPALLEALEKIAGLIDSEAGEPLDEAIEIATAALKLAKGD